MSLRQCLFCESDANSGEHMFPLWLLRRFDTPSGVRVSLERGSRQLPEWKMACHDHRVRFVCTACNNGWMSNLENSAKPVLERLLSDQSTVLDPKDQSIIAAWSAKCAMVFEVLRDGKEYFYTAEDRSDLKTRQNVPNHTVIYVAKCVELPGVYVKASDHSDTRDHSILSTRLYSTTMGFGHLAVQVATMKSPILIPGIQPRITTDVVPGPWEDTTLTLQQSGLSLAWPAAISLNGELGLIAFANRWKVQHDPTVVNPLQGDVDRK